MRMHKGKPVYSDFEATAALIRTGDLRVLPDRAGRCFRLAYHAVLRGFGVFIIGIAIGKDEPLIYHAVAESRTGRLYYDGTMDACFTVPVYTNLFGWCPVLRMTIEEVRRFSCEVGKYPDPVTLNLPPLIQHATGRLGLPIAAGGGPQEESQRNGRLIDGLNLS